MRVHEKQKRDTKKESMRKKNKKKNKKRTGGANSVRGCKKIKNRIGP